MSASSGLNVAQSEKKMWLVKFPPMVAQRLHALAAQAEAGGDAAGQPIGRVRLAQNATQVMQAS